MKYFSSIFAQIELYFLSLLTMELQPWREQEEVLPEKIRHKSHNESPKIA